VRVSELRNTSDSTFLNAEFAEISDKIAEIEDA
jgi:hypothetical protein